METLKRYLIESNKKTFLDIGTGSGNFIHFIKSLYDNYEKIVGIDVIDRAIEMAKEHNKDDKVEFKVMDAYNMEYEDNTFDVICLSNSLHHVDDIPALLNSMSRVMKEDGYIIINEMLADHLDKRQVSHKLLHEFAAKLDRIHNQTHYDTFTEQEILDKVQKGTPLNIEKHWHVDVPKRGENTEEELQYIYNLLDRVSNRIPEENKDALLKEKESIKEYIKENGYDGCTSILLILKK